ncbi:MAG: tRNA (adenosine(37)-N6)-threonylcarbamoyltransferase complex dimerization subunit type 1 TsaB [Bulleidia sp.]
MLTLCMDTSHVFLVLGLIRDDELIASFQETCWKKQSEEIFPQLVRMCESVQAAPEDIDQIVISKGPGSYTGVRIAMTIAKVFCAMKQVPLYTISTLQLYAGDRTCRVLIDARGGRAYTNTFVNGVPQGEDTVCTVSELTCQETSVIGDGHLISKEDNWPEISLNFVVTKPYWTANDNVHLVVPEYLKSAASYLPPKK